MSFITQSPEVGDKLSKLNFLGSTGQRIPGNWFTAWFVESHCLKGQWSDNLSYLSLFEGSYLLHNCSPSLNEYKAIIQYDNFWNSLGQIY